MRINKQIGQRIKEAREALNLSQKHLGKAVNYSTSTISQIENGNFRLSLESLEKMAKVLQKPLTYFISKEEPSQYKLSARLASLERELSKITSSLNKDIIKARKEHFYIVIWGNIRIGKNEIIKKLGDIFKAKTFYGLEDKNPYQLKFYKNKRKWAFHNELFFLIENLNQQNAIQKNLGPVIHEWSIYENYHVWISTLNDLKCFSKTEYSLLTNLYNYGRNLARKPDLIVYLKGNPRKIWQKIPKEEKAYYSQNYLQRIHNKYEALTKTFEIAPVMTVDIDKTGIFDEGNVLKLAEKIKDAL